MLNQKMITDMTSLIADAKKQLTETEDTINFFRKAGEDVSKLEETYRATKSRIDKWTQALKSEGITV